VGKKERFNDVYEVVNKRTGKVVDNKLAFDMVKSISKEYQVDGLKKKKEGLKKLYNRKTIKLQVMEAGSFGLYKFKEMIDVELKLEERGLWEVFIIHVRDDSSCEVNLPCHHTKTDISKYLKINKNRFSSMLETLKSNNLIDFYTEKRILNIIVNPEYFRVGNKVDESIINRFNLDKE